MLRWFQRKDKKRGAPGPLPEQVPDSPIPFGYKTGWLCVQADGPREVMEALGLEGGVPCGWAEGLAQAERGGVFVSPALDGSVLVVGWMEENLDRLSGLAAGFPRLQYFASHRVVDYCAWASYLNGELLRAYAYTGDRGEVVWDRGELTREEIALGGARFPRMGKEADWDEAEFPDEETVISLAAAWGVDTSFSEKEYPPALGWLCRRTH